MEGITLVLCRNFRRISPLLLLYYSDIFCNSPPRRGGPNPFHSLLYSLSNAMTVPAANAPSLRFHWPLYSLRDNTGRNKAPIRGSCSSTTQKGMSTGMVNNRLAYFPICLLYKNFIKRGITTICVLYGLLS